MQVAILSARPGWHTAELCRALAERGHHGIVLPYEGLLARFGLARRGSVPTSGASLDVTAGEGRTPLFEADAVLARIIPGGSLEQIIYRVDALHWVEQRGVAVMNSPKTIERCVDKFYTTALLHDAGLPTPETVVCESAHEAVAAVAAMGDAVIKPIFGSMGHGLVRVSDPDVAYRVARSLEQLRAVFYVQRAIDHQGRDVRAFVVGGRVIGAIERRARDGEWRTNLARGASARPLRLPAGLEDLVLRAAAAVGADYAGVDLLPSGDGRVFVMEVNGIPGWRGLQEATGRDVARAIADHLIARAAQGRGRSSVAECQP